MHRPALLAAASFAAGVLLAHLWELPVWTLWAGGLAFWIVSLIRWRRRSVWPMALFVALGALRYESVTQGLPDDHVARLAGRDHPVVLHGRVAEEPEWIEDGLRLRLAAESATVRDTVYSIRGAVLVRFWKFRPQVDYGDRLVIRLNLRRPHPARNPGAFDYRAFLKRKGIHAMGSVFRTEQVLDTRSGRGGWLWTYVVLPVRRGVRRGVANNLSGGPAGLLNGVLLGEKRGVPDTVRTAFTRAGVNHVLAVSGLHVGLIAAVVFFGLGALGCGRRTTAWATVCGVSLYALVTGLSPSVVRAAMMCAITIWGRLGNTQGEGLNSLGLAALVILVFRPQDLFDVGSEGIAVDGAIEHHGGVHTVQAQPSDEGGGLPVTKGQGGVQTLATRATAAQAGHVGLGRGLIDDHQPLRPQSLLPDVPAAAFAADVGPVLLGRPRSFF